MRPSELKKKKLQKGDNLRETLLEIVKKGTT